MTLVVPSSLIQSPVCLQAGGSVRPVPVPGHDVSRPVFSHTVSCMFAGRRVCEPGQYQCSDMTLVIPSSLIQSPVCLQAGGSVRPVPVPGHDVSRPVFSHTVSCMFAGRRVCEPGQYQCSDNACIYSIDLCDGITDCSDGADEAR